MTPVTFEMFDQWITDPQGPVAIRLTQALRSASASPVIFPPTYADIGYNIDTLADGTRVVTVDSVGSQANRLEPVFQVDSPDPERWLVPQIRIVIRHEPCGTCLGCVGQTTCQQPRPVAVSLLEYAHRAADVVVQSTDGLGSRLIQAFQDLRLGNAYPLGTLAPTSLIFGVWDSRGTGVKRPRLVRALIRAWDVELLHASAQFRSSWRLFDAAQQDQLNQAAGTKPSEQKEVMSKQMGLRDAPAPHTLGGVLVHGRIERDVLVNLVALRGIQGATDVQTQALRRYLLGLALTAATQDIDLFLREGCLLQYGDDDQWMAVPRRGDSAPVTLEHAAVLAYAHEAARPFRAQWPQVFADRWPTLDYPLDFEALRSQVRQAKQKKTAVEDDAK